MKQTFTLEIDCPAIENYGLNPLFAGILQVCLKHGMSYVMEHKIMEDLKISIVEQNHETPENVNQKAFDLLRQAAGSLTKSDYAYDRNLGEEIEEYIRNNTREQTE